MRTVSLSTDAAFSQLKDLAYESVDEFAKIDHHRSLRTGFPEVIWGLDKTPEQIARIMEVMRLKNQVVMATRITPEVFVALQPKVRGLRYYEYGSNLRDRTCYNLKFDIPVQLVFSLLELPIYQLPKKPQLPQNFLVSRYNGYGMWELRESIAC